jgi:DNA polymerase-3 subunit delta'
MFLIDKMPWVNEPQRRVERWIARDQLPQALLIHGPTGVGRSDLAVWMAVRLLANDPPERERLMRSLREVEGGLAHPDFMAVRPLPEKQIIGVDQVRSLIGFLHLTSHGGGRRVALLAPAEAMSHAAANSLLKTLEEAPKGVVIILIAESPAQLPATIVSRCQRLLVCKPERPMAVRWLGDVLGEEDWDLLLEFTCGAPIGAAMLYRDGFLAVARSYRQDLRDLQSGTASPVTVARRWASGDLAVAMRWLYGRIAEQATTMAAHPAEEPLPESRDRPLKSDRKQLTIHQVMERLRDIEDFLRNRGKSMNMELQLSALLQHWAAPQRRAAGG